MAQLTENEFIIPDGSVVEGAQPMKSSGLTVSDIWDSGWFQINDLATHTTPVLVTGDETIHYLPNDGLGEGSNSTPPQGVTSVWNSTTNRFDWTQLSVGDIVDIRADVFIDTGLSNSTELYVGYSGRMGDASVFSISGMESYLTKSHQYRFSPYMGTYIGNELTRTLPAAIGVRSDSDVEVVVNGWYVKITKQRVIV